MSKTKKIKNHNNYSVEMRNDSVSKTTYTILKAFDDYNEAKLFFNNKLRSLLDTYDDKYVRHYRATSPDGIVLWIIELEEYNIHLRLKRI